MAISRVGSKTNNHNNSATGLTFTFATDLLDDSNVAVGAGAIQTGDLVIVAIEISGTTDLAQSALTPTGYTAAHTDSYQNDNFDSNFQVSYKVMGGTPDTTLQIPPVPTTASQCCFCVIVLRGVDTTTPMDVAPVVTGGTNTGVANAAAITPVTAGAWIIAFAGSAVAAANIYTAPTNMSSSVGAFRTVQGTGVTNQAVAGYSTLTTWTSGAFDPNAFGGSTSTNTGSWSAVTVAVRPLTSIALSVNAANSAGATDNVTIQPKTLLVNADASATSTTSNVTITTTDPPGVLFVGSIGGLVGAATTTVNFNTLVNQFGATPSILPGDLVVISQCQRNTANVAPTVVTAGYTAAYSNVYANGSTNDANLITHYKFMGPTPDTSVDLGSLGFSNTGSYVIHVFRGVSQVTPLDGVAPTTSTALGIASPDAPSITPSTAGDWIYVAGAAAGATGGTDTTALTNPANLSSATNHFRAGTNDRAKVAAGLKTDWTTGAFDPATFGGGSTASIGSVAAASLVLKPAASGSVALTVNAAASASVTDAPSLTFHTPLTVQATSSTDQAGNISTDLLANGDFTSNVTGWTIDNGTFVFVAGGTGRLTSNGAVDAQVRAPTSSTTLGHTYRVDWSVTAITGGGQAAVYAGDNTFAGLNTYVSQNIFATGSGSAMFQHTNAGITQLAVGFIAQRFAPTTVDFDYVHVYDLSCDVNLVFHAALAMNAAASAGTTDNVTLAPKTTLTVANDNTASTTSSPTLSPKTALTVAAANSGSTTSSPTLTPKTALTVNGGNSAGATDNVTLSPKTALTVAAANTASTTDSPTLTPKTGLTVNPASSADVTDNVTVSPKTSLTVNPASSAGATDNTTLTIHASGLTVNPASSAGATDNVTLLPRTSLTVNPANTADVTTSPTLSPKTALTVNAANTASVTTSPTLTPKTALVLAAAASAGSTDNVVLLPKTALAVAAAQSAATAAGITLAARTALLVSSALTSTITDSPVLVPRTALAVAAAASLSTTAALAVASRYALVVDPAISLEEVQHAVPTVTTPTPQSRKVSVGGSLEDRNVSPGGGPRVAELGDGAANDRVATPTGGARTASVSSG